MVIKRNVGCPNLNLGGALTKSGGTSVHIVRLSKREIVGSLTYLPFLLSRIGLAISVPVFSISDAVHCNRPRSALQPSLQCTASVLAVHCIRSCSALPVSNTTFTYGKCRFAWPHHYNYRGLTPANGINPYVLSYTQESLADDKTTLRIFPLGRSSS